MNFSTIGDNNVIIGNRNVHGSGNVIIDATDLNGNSILNRPMIIWNNAKGGSNDTVVGANAGSTDSNSEVFMLLANLQGLLQSNKDVYDAINNLADELALAQRDTKKIKGLWWIVESAATVEGAIGLASRIAPIIIQLISS